MDKKISLSLFSLLGLLGVGCSPCLSGSDEDIALCLSKEPKEEVRRNVRVRNYLQKHKVYVSMTTSPKRISKITMVLKSLDLDLVEKVFVALPAKFRDQEEYVIPQELRDFPKVEILQEGADLGPIMKLLPAVAKVKALDEQAIVMTVDDDVGYGADLPGQLIKNAILFDAVVGSKGLNIDAWNVDASLWPEQFIRAPSCYSGFDVSYCDVLEGFGAVAYPVKWVDVELLSTLSLLSKACKTSDDIVIGFGLAVGRAPRALLTTLPFFDVAIPFGYGFEEDALQRGSGFLDAVSGGNTNSLRYNQCIKDMNVWAKSNEL